MRNAVQAATRSTSEYWESRGNHWNTPAAVLDRVRELAPIALDPCSNPTSIVRAAVEYSAHRGEDGLEESWRGRGLVFVNPPYGRNLLDLWCEKAAREFPPGPLDGDELVMLLPSSTDTRWFHRHARRADVLCMWGPGRVRFVGAPGKFGPTFGSVLLYRGERPARFVEVFAPVGWCIGAGQADGSPSTKGE